MDSYELSLVCAKDKSNKSWGFARASELFHAHEKVIMFISAEGKKKNLLRKKKKNLKRRRLEGKSHMEHQRRGGQAQRAQSHPQQNLSQKQPLEILSLYYRALKENENQQEAGMVLSSLHKSWTAPGSPFFFLPVLRNSAATEKMISPVYTTHNSIVGFDVSKGSFNPNE